jgi:hypothetical protein
MRVWCCLDGTNGEQVSKATEVLAATQSLILGALYVVLAREQFPIAR